MPVKVKVYTQGHDAFLGSRANIDMELPAVPRIGECPAILLHKRKSTNMDI